LRPLRLSLWLLGAVYFLALIMVVTCFPTLSSQANAPIPSGGVSSLTDHEQMATISATDVGSLRSYILTSNAELRDNTPPNKRAAFAESPEQARVRSGNLMFDGLYTLALHEAQEDSVSQISDGSYGHGAPIDLQSFQTGAKWTYVWTRDLSYSTDLALAGLDPDRAMNSLLFKTSLLKPSVTGGSGEQIIQDTGSGGSYPVSTDRVVWSLGASRLAEYLPDAAKLMFVKKAYPILKDTLEQDRHLVFDPADGLYRGEQSFLDWREQTYPLWTKDNVLPIAESKALSTNCIDYFALRTASKFAEQLGLVSDQKRYATWATALKQAINNKFYDAKAGLYSTYLLDDGGDEVRAHHYDLLGESLAILFGIAPEAFAKRILSTYPTGPYGPPVVWPESRSVPIYHNHAIWPFVTAYWIKAACRVGNVAAVDNGMASLMRGAALNLSNMENFDFGTGKSWVSNGILTGPVIDSQRQIWSVAGYLSMVQDVVFGLDTSWSGIRFRPFVTAHARRSIFAASDLIELRNFHYQGKAITVRIHLPHGRVADRGVCRIQSIVLNGKHVGTGFVASASLPLHNAWDIFLEAPDPSANPIQTLRVVSDENSVFSPAQPAWEDIGQNGLTVTNGLVTLHYRAGDTTNVTFNIYRDGSLCAKGVKTLEWTDPRSGDYASTTHFYCLEAVGEKTGNASHLTPTRFYLQRNAETVITAKHMENLGGDLVDGHHFENWGRISDELRVDRFTVARSGRYLIRAEYANGAGPINTGITCAVKALDIYNAGSQTRVVHGYLVMPQSGDWTRFESSSVIRADLKAGVRYSLHLGEDAYCRNMSYLQKNMRYTAGSGGGGADFNYVNIAAIHLLRIANEK
jgi:hypothetical protein